MLSRRSFLVSSVGALATPSLLLAQRTGPHEREIVPQVAANDKEDVWTLHFRFQAARIIVEKVRARGTRVIWYIRYAVYNLDPKGEPVRFYPDFELVTLDRNTRHMDEVLPSVEKIIREREDPTGRFNIKNSVTISAEDIPVSKKDAYPRVVNGLAIWTDVDPVADGKDKTPRTNN